VDKKHARRLHCDSVSACLCEIERRHVNVLKHFFFKLAVTPSPIKSINVASILHSLVKELKSVAISNSKLHDKLNRLNMIASTSIPKSNAQPINLLIVVHSESDTNIRSIQLAKKLTASLSSSIKSKFIVGS